MYLWRFSIAMIFGLVWYFSDYGRAVTQYVLCFLCCISTPHFFQKTARESSTQTEWAEEEFQETSDDGNIFGYDVTDIKRTKAQESEFPDAKQSLLRVFECAYAQLVVPWYNVPEPCESQPLHQLLWKEFDSFADQVISHAKDFDVCNASVGCIRILTQHLHNAKQSDREPFFSSRAQEVAVLRVFSEALVRNLFPESLKGLDINHCALKEIVALKVFELLVKWFSDPDNLNQLVVSQMEGVTPKTSVEELSDSDSDRASPASQQSGGSGATLDENEDSQTSAIKSKKKANKLKEGWAKFVEKMTYKKDKKKKLKKKQRKLMFRAIEIQDLEDDGSSREGSIQNQQDSDSEDSDLESYMTSVQEDMMEFKLSYEMWRVGHWTVSVPFVERENEELCFTVHLEERDNPENLHWGVKKAKTEVIYFRNRWQDTTSLPSLSVLEDCSERAVDEEFMDEARTSLQLFLQGLVSDDLIGHSQPVFQFLCPLDKLMNEEDHPLGVWGLLSNLAFFLTPGQEEDEHNNVQVEAKPEALNSPSLEVAPPTAPETLNENRSVTSDALPSPAITITNSDPPSDPPQGCGDQEAASTVKLDSLSKSTSSLDKAGESENALTSHLKMIIKGLSRCRSEESLFPANETSPEVFNDSDRKPHSSQNGGAHCDITDGPSWLGLTSKANRKEKVCLRLPVGRGKGKDQDSFPREECLKKDQSNWEQLEATKAIFDLLKEISGNSILLNIFDAILKPVMPIMKKKVNTFLDKLNPTEAQMASYIDNLRDKQWPEGAPQEPRRHRSPEEKNEAKDRAHSLINSRYSNYLILKKTDMETVFNIFQDCEENKKLVYMLLSFLLRELLPGEDALNVNAIALQKVNASYCIM